MKKVLVLLGTLLALPALGQEVATGTATLSWNIPTTYVDGSPLPVSEIEGYTIYWGTESGNYTRTLELDNGAVQSRVVELEVTEPTRFYFAMTTRATNGKESGFSNEASKLIEFEYDDIAPGAPQNVELSISMECETTESGRTCRVVIGE